MSWFRSSLAAIVFVIGLTQTASAQGLGRAPARERDARTQDEAEQADQKQADQRRTKQREQRGAKQVEPVEGLPVETHDYAPPGEEPMPPGRDDFQSLSPPGGRADVAVDAGVGSPLAYASATVVELGAVLALRHQSELTEFRIAPSVGYFFFDNVELTLFPELSVVHVDGESDVVLGAMLEPSYHLPFSKRLLGFLGIGAGLRYAEDPGADFALRPRLGLDILLGRSGIFKPAAFVDIGARDGLSAGGFEAGVTIML